MEGGMVAVDRWSSGSQAYFLTHLHADHTRGLSPSWSRGPLFCSRTTAKLLPFQFPQFDVSLLRVVDLATWYPLSLLSPSSSAPSLFHFFALPALHCPGAVMFLFRGDFGHTLYTGDFRWEAGDSMAHEARTMLLNALNGAKVDVLYLDNTYCNPTYSFPSRQLAAQQVINIIKSHPKSDIIIGIDSLGKEELLVEISRVLKVKIWVWPERLQTMHLLGLPDIFTTNTSLTRIRAVPRYSFSVDTLEGLNSTFHPTIGIMPSGLPWVVKSKEGKKSFCSPSVAVNKQKKSATDVANGADKIVKSVQKVHKYIYSVPYSDHSCYSEIEEFVQLLQPTHVRGIVSISSCYVDPNYHLRLLRSNHPSQSRHMKVKSEEGAKTPSKDLGSGKSMAVNIKKRSPGDHVGIQTGRVSILRKAMRQRGVKIDETDDND